MPTQILKQPHKMRVLNSTVRLPVLLAITWIGCGLWLLLALAIGVVFASDEMRARMPHWLSMPFLIVPLFIAYIGLRAADDLSKIGANRRRQTLVAIIAVLPLLGSWLFLPLVSCVLGLISKYRF